jgi:hypothetical protein
MTYTIEQVVTLAETVGPALAITAADAQELLDITKKLSQMCPSNEGLGGHAPLSAFFALAEDARSAIDRINQY